MQEQVCRNRQNSKPRGKQRSYLGLTAVFRPHAAQTILTSRKFLVLSHYWKRERAQLFCFNLNYMSIYLSDIIMDIGHFFSSKNNNTYRMKHVCLSVHGNYITKISAFVTPSLMPFLQTFTSSCLVDFQSYLKI